jgi:outer membrane protein OmpA-like peptidoglycan-associated protein
MSETLLEALGEEVPRDVATALAGFGVACALGAALLLSTELSRTESLPAPASMGAAPERTPPPPVERREPTAHVEAAHAAAASVPSAPPACAPLVVEFPSAEVHVGRDALRALDRLGRWLAEHRQVSATVDGHADALGGADANMQLSRLRAASVASLLSAGGAQQGQLRVRWFGAFVPVDGSPADGAQNRRVVVRAQGELCPKPTEEGSLP